MSEDAGAGESGGGAAADTPAPVGARVRVRPASARKQRGPLSTKPQDYQVNISLQV